ncbi:MAG: ATP-binding protein, partial [Bacteroidota bacterium]
MKSIKTFLGFLIFFGIVFFSHGIFAQDNPTLESVKATFDLAASRFDAGDFNRAVEYGQKGLENAVELEDDQLALVFKSLLGNSYLELGKYKDATNYFLQIIIGAKQRNNTSVAAEGYYALANVYAQMGAYVQSAETYRASSELFSQLGIREKQLETLTGTAFNFKFAADYENAIIYLEQLLSMVEGDPFYNASYNEQLVEIYRELEEWNKAAMAAKEVYDYRKNNGSRSERASIVRQLSWLYSEAGNAAEALRYANMALDVAPASIEGNRLLGLAQLISGDIEEAINTLNQTLNLVIASPNDQQKALIYTNLSSAYLQSGEIEKAKTSIIQAEKVAETLSGANDRKRVYNVGSQVGGKAGDQAMVNRFRQQYKEVESTQNANERSKRAQIERANNLAKRYERDLTLKITQSISKNSVQKSQQLSYENAQRQKQLQLKQNELADSRRENEEIRSLNERNDSLIAIISKSAENYKLEAETTRIERDSASAEAFAAMSENQKTQVLLDQQKRLTDQEQAQKAQQRQIFIGAIVSVVLILLVILFAYYKTNESKKIIKAQKNGLEDKQKIISKRNLQLKKSSNYLLKSNNELKRAKNHLKDSLSKEQMMRSELEKINSELKNTQVQLIHAEKMSSLGQLTAGIAHEINNPINFVLNSANIIGMNFDDIKEILDHILAEEDGEKIVGFLKTLDIEELQDSIEIIIEMLGNLKYGADRVTEIVKGLRTFSRFDEAEIKTVDIHENLESSLLILHNKYSDQNIIIEKEFDSNLPEIECYPGQLNQVFVNIINNAIDVLADNKNPVITIGTAFEDDKAIISIEDNGTGIPAEIQEKIFDPF